ncbi:MAG: cell division protein ZapA, partial [Vicinamibacterales bacterium]
PRVVHVEVSGQTYPIRTALDARYVSELAAFVQQRMELAADSSPSSDTLGLAILVALNIADEYFRSRSNSESANAGLSARAEALERIVDEALALSL